jgi:hypothetical protein
MEFVKRRRRLTEPEGALLCLQLLDTMRYLHANGIIHRDLKLGNLFVASDMEIRVGDFGLATQLSEPSERKRTVCGTPNYIAPEILDGNLHGGHSFEVDIWAFGVILYTLVVGRPPFETQDVKSTYKRIRENSYSFPPDVPLSNAVMDLIRRILVPRPADRPSIDAIAHHAFFMNQRIPRALPTSALTAMPAFSDEDLIPGAAAVSAIFSRPTGGMLHRQPNGTRTQAAAPAWGEPRPGPYELAAAAAKAAAVPRPEGSSVPHALSVRDSNGPTLAFTGKSGGSAAPPPPPPLRAPANTLSSMAPQWTPLVAAADSAVGAAPAAAAPRPPLRPWEETLLRAAAGAAGAPRSAPSSLDGETPRIAGFAPSSHYDKENSSVPWGGKMGAERLGGGALSASSAASTTGGDTGASLNNACAHVGSGAPLGSAGTSDGASGTGPTPSSTPRLDGASSAERLPGDDWLAALHSSTGTASTGDRPRAFVPDAAPIARNYTDGPVSPSLPPPPPMPTAYFSNAVVEAAAPLTVPSRSARAPLATVNAVPSSAASMTVASLRSAAASLDAAPTPYNAISSPKGGGAFRQVTSVSAAAASASATAASTAAVTSPTSSHLNDSLRVLHAALSNAVSGATQARPLSPRGALGQTLVPARLRVSAYGARGLAAAGLPPPAQWVTTWIDYSAKYGLGYLLSSGVVGVYFNDSTKLVLEPQGHERIEYSERSPAGSTPSTCSIPNASLVTGPDGGVRAVATLSDYPPELRKKVTLLRHFRDYLIAQSARRAAGPSSLEYGAATPFGAAAASAGGGLATVTTLVPVSEEEAAVLASGRSAPPSAPGSLPLVKKWVRSRRAVLFRLSGGQGSQVAFYDGASLVFEPGGSRVHVFDTAGRRAAFAVAPLLDAAAAAARAPSAALAAAGVATIQELEDLSARVRYARDIMSQVISGAAAPAAAPAAH